MFRLSFKTVQRTKNRTKRKKPLKFTSKKEMVRKEIITDNDCVSPQTLQRVWETKDKTQTL